jgi:hypothetical protein
MLQLGLELNAELDLRMNWFKALLRPLSTPAEQPPPPSPYHLDDALRLHLAPVLRADGFKGSGRTYRRTVNGVVQVVNVQGSRSGGSFAINLGLHPLALPIRSGQQADPRKINEIDCAFRRRLREDERDQWWSHDSAESAVVAAQAAAEVYRRVGQALLERQSGPDAPIWTLRPDELDQAGKRLEGFTLYTLREGALASLIAQIRHASRDVATARAFARRAREEGLTGVDLAELEALVGPIA